MKIQVNVDFPRKTGFKSGDIVVVDSNSKGRPTSQFWRRRLKDAESDGCCEIVTENPEPVVEDESGLSEE